MDKEKIISQSKSKKISNNKFIKNTLDFNKNRISSTLLKIKV